MPNEAIDMSDRELQEGDMVLIPARVVEVSTEHHWFNLRLVTSSPKFGETSLALNSRQVYLDSPGCSTGNSTGGAR